MRNELTQAEAVRARHGQILALWPWKATPDDIEGVASVFAEEFAACGEPASPAMCRLPHTLLLRQVNTPEMGPLTVEATDTDGKFTQAEEDDS